VIWIVSEWQAASRAKKVLFFDLAAPLFAQAGLLKFHTTFKEKNVIILAPVSCMVNHA